VSQDHRNRHVRLEQSHDEVGTGHQQCVPDMIESRQARKGEDDQQGQRTDVGNELGRAAEMPGSDPAAPSSAYGKRIRRRRVAAPR
jgi:hypothetical protein